VPKTLPNNKKQAIVSAKDLNLLVRILIANWWVPIIVLPIFYAMGVFYVYKLTNVYKASTEFLLKSNDTYYQSNVVTDANFYAYGSYVDNLNETRIIQSYDLSRAVVDKLINRIQVSYFVVCKVVTTEDFEGMPFKIIPDSVEFTAFEQRFDLKVIDSDNYEITYPDKGTSKVKKGRFNTLDDLLKVRIEKISDFSGTTPESRKTLEDMKASFYQFTVHSRDNLISGIRNNLFVDNPQYTNVLRIELKDVMPERAVLILDTLNSVYAMSKLKTKYELNERTILYIDKQLNEITFSLKSIEDTMQGYKESRSIIDLDWQRGDFLTKIGGYDKEISQSKLEIQELNNLEKYIIEDKDPQFLPPSIFISEKGGYMAHAVQDLYTKQIRLNDLFNSEKAPNPKIIELKSSIIKTKQDLLVYINNTRNATGQKIDGLSKAILNYIGEAKLIPGKQRDILNIQRKATVSEQLYNFLLEKKASTKIAKASIVPDIKIVESPRFIGLDSPDKPKIQKQFVTFGLLLTILIVVIRLFFFTKIKTVDHLKELTELPLIGVLPIVKKAKGDEIIVDQSPNSLIAESFRNFRTNLQYAHIGIDAKTFLVTSFLPGEGKTFTSVNLATILAKSGKRTVIIELDLHKPKIYKRFGLPAQTKGITTFITGQSTLEEIVSATHIDNLHCIYSGPIPPNPSEFVLSEKMKELINYAKASFDYVIIDTPPAGLLSDSVYLIQYVDASIFVLNTKSSSKKVISFIESLIEDNGLKNINIILNGVKNMGRKYYYQGYGYSYGYGYGYGYGKGSANKK